MLALKTCGDPFKNVDCIKTTSISPIHIVSINTRMYSLFGGYMKIGVSSSGE